MSMTSRTITTDAIARCEAAPDLAIVEAVAIGEAESAGAARAIAKDRAFTLRKSVTDVSPDQVRTVDLQVQDTDEIFDPATDAPFQATERLHIECLPENAEAVVVDVTTAGGQIQSVHFHLHEDKHLELQNKAIRSAMERAREKAEQIASVEGLVLAEIQEATTKEVSTGLETIADEAFASSPDTNLHPAPITVSEGVEVVYELAEK
ncbi:SIMPL domain-containing protein [Haloplanus rubicundus]|uniref:SIMPL domain-containing protein n=1 Tax=Haloplanus rubicundus TaxID=1547898 RepID=A0A345E8H5_9EURY|nr:SIMPL domain-containing protein [Haloplanus rubicundus]AXG08497.1 SIMPL domain-containing protein [Haloplanus rubicundus]